MTTQASLGILGADWVRPKIETPVLWALGVERALLVPLSGGTSSCLGET
ncbi:hypothetical protein [Pseudomonas brassicacearum]|nr:hypothetical protein [Pseudomonas brassicacearum]